VVLHLCGERSSYGDAAEPDKSEQTSQWSAHRRNKKEVIYSMQCTCFYLVYFSSKRLYFPLVYHSEKNVSCFTVYPQIYHSVLSINTVIE